MKVWIRNINAFFCARYFFVGESENITRLHVHAAAFNFAHAQFGTLQVAKYCDVVWLGCIDVANVFYDLQLVFVRTVRKVKPEHVYPSLYQFKQFLRGIACGAYGCNNFCTMKSMVQTGLLIHLPV